ncbi:MAG: 3-oxoacyl-[acyl-carrier-protein] reductase [Chloroflexi bacterium]|nr:3-oxoacyl-[acyl-carrier-protein] reductase [Chloroflexota bacterium]
MAAADLAGKVALVTGSGRGIGKAISLKLASHGCDVIISDVLEQDGRATAEEVQRLGVKSVFLSVNVTDTASVERLFQEAQSQMGGVDILVNNAGITKDNLLLRLSDADWDAVLSVNLKGAFLCTRAALKQMLRKRWGRIINIASVVGIQGNAGQANYAASKAGLIGLTKTAAKELGSRNITANAIAPGFIQTQMTEKLSPEVQKEVIKRIPLGSLGTPEDVAATVAFLASEEARYITGQVIGVDGGLSLG